MVLCGGGRKAEDARHTFVALGLFCWQAVLCASDGKVWPCMLVVFMPVMLSPCS